MSNLVTIDGRESTMQQKGAGIRSDLRHDQYGNLAVSQSLPKYADLVLNNKVFAANTGAGTGAAPEIALVTTVANFLLHNSSSTVSLLMLRSWVYVMSGTRAIGSSLWAGVSTPEEATAPTKHTGSVGPNALGTGGSSVAIFDQDVTLDAAIVWNMIAQDDKLADANESSGMMANDFEGLFIVPPKGNFAMSVYDSAAGTTPLYGGGFVWAELPLRSA